MQRNHDITFLHDFSIIEQIGKQSLKSRTRSRQQKPKNSYYIFLQSQSFIVMKLTHFWPMFLFYTTWKHQETFSFLVFSGGIKCKHLPEMGIVVWSCLENEVLFKHNWPIDVCLLWAFASKLTQTFRKQSMW